MKNYFSLIVVFLAMPCAGQTPASTTPIAKFDDADARSVGTGSSNRIVLEAGDADAKATARLAKLFGNGPEYGRYAFTVTAPFDSKKADKVEVGTLSGLTSGTSASFEYSLLKWTKATQTEQTAITAACEAAIPRLIPGYTWKQVGRVTSLNCNQDILDLQALREAVDSINKMVAACSSPTPPSSEECKQVAPGSTVVSGNAERVIEEIYSNVTDVVHAASRPMKSFTFSVKANEQSFSYVTADALTTTQTSSKTGYGAAFAYSYIGRRSLWSVGYAHEESYKSSPKLEVCSPIGTTGSLSCSEAIIGAPKKDGRELGFVELRRLIQAGQFALAPRLEFDFEESSWAARLPFYFITNKDDQLTAGVALGYTDEDDEFGASVFVSKAFAFFD
jgi:hypothetical protein